MAKYTIRYNIICTHEVEIEADSAADALMKSGSDYFPASDIIQDFAESFPKDLSDADVQFECIFDKDGNYVA